MTITLTNEQVRQAVQFWMYHNTDAPVFDPKLIHFTHNASTQTITASLTIKNEKEWKN